jgi:hypothetical protein
MQEYGLPPTLVTIVILTNLKWRNLNCWLSTAAIHGGDSALVSLHRFFLLYACESHATRPSLTVILAVGKPARQVRVGPSDGPGRLQPQLQKPRAAHRRTGTHSVTRPITRGVDRAMAALGPP